MRLYLTLPLALAASWALVGCGPKEDTTPPAVPPPSSVGNTAAPAPGAPAANPSAGGPPAGVSFEGSHMPAAMKAQMQQKGAPIK